MVPDALPALGETLKGYTEKPVLFLDFDGTLADITNDPARAALSPGMRKVLVRLKGLVPHLALVSGRDRADVVQKVGLPDIYYAGSHGFDISGPDGFHDHLDAANDMLPQLDEAERSLKQRLQDVEGSLVERKRFAIAIHYRNVREDEVVKVKEAVEEEHSRRQQLKMLGGKKIYELKPDVEWDKGKAVLWLLDRFQADTGKAPVFYLGDDLTDEDAFKALGDRGTGIIVGQEDRETHARYSLRDIDAVQQWLEKLADTLEA
jgi:trehalose-phosphatase